MHGGNLKLILKSFYFSKIITYLSSADCIGRFRVKGKLLKMVYIRSTESTFVAWQPPQPGCTSGLGSQL
jgi:hypothetical protein